MAIALVVLTGIALLSIWYIRQEPQRLFTRERQKLIDDAKRSTPDLAGAYRIETRTEDGRPSEIRYYRDDELIAADIVDDRGKVVRRDLFDGSSLRVQLFYDVDGRVVATRIFDGTGGVHTTTPLLPVPAIRGGY